MTWRVNRRQEAEVDIHRRKVFLRCGHVTAQRADRRFRRRNHQVIAARSAYRVDAGNESGRDILDVALRACQLACKEDPGVAFCSHRRQQNLRCVNVRIPMNLSQPQEFGIFKARNHPEDALLLSEL